MLRDKTDCLCKEPDPVNKALKQSQAHRHGYLLPRRPSCDPSLRSRSVSHRD